MDLPEPRRASLSGYVQPGKLLPWQWVDARMEASRNYWITTHSARRNPHSRPVWDVWTAPELWFSTGSLIDRNLRANEHVEVHLESADEVVIIEGVAVPLRAENGAIWADAYNLKYSWDMPTDVTGVWTVQPSRVMAWLCDSSGLDGGAGFSNSATEWSFR